MRKFTLVLLALVGLAAFVYASGQSTATGEPKAVTITLMEGPTWDAEIPEGFMKAHPEISVERISVPGSWEDYERKVLTMAASGDSADVIVFQDEPFPAYAARGVFGSMDEFMKADNVVQDLKKKKEFLDGALEAFQFDPKSGNFGKGNQYGMSFGGGEVLLYYNKDMLKAAGLVDPPANWTWDDLLQYSLKLTKREGGRTTQWGLAIPTWWLYSWMPFIWSNAGDFYNKDFSASVFDSPENVESLTFLNDLVNKHKVAPVPSVAASAGMGPRNMFHANSMAMSMNGPWDVGASTKAAREEGFDFDISPNWPPNKAGEKYRKTRLTFDGVVLSAGAKGDKAKAGFEFIRWTCAEGGQEVIADIGRIMPAMKWAAMSELWADPSTPWREEAFVEGFGHARLQPVTLMWPKFNEELWKQHDLLLTGAQTPLETVKATDGIIKRLVEENKQVLAQLQSR